MLERSFIHVPGVGKQTEQNLWKQGCRDWSSFVDGRFSAGRAPRSEVIDFLQRSRHCLDHGEHQFFRKHLGLKEAWRAYRSFTHSCVYLDIETDGRSVTTIGMYDGSNFRCLIKGENLENFRDEISHFSMIVTFCGASFDLPQLERQFKGLQFDQIHVDLCPLLRKLGFRGGLKRIEKDLDIQRPGEVDGLTGLDAVILWRRYYGLGDSRALDKLIAYNREDCVNLKALAETAVSRAESALLEGLN